MVSLHDLTFQVRPSIVSRPVHSFQEGRPVLGAFLVDHPAWAVERLRQEVEVIALNLPD